MSTRIPHAPPESSPALKRKKTAQSLLTLHCFDPYKIKYIEAARYRLDTRVRSPEKISLGNHDALLFFPQPSHNSPPWVRLLRPYAEHAKELKNQSHSALILLDVDHHIFAATFGRAQHLLPRDVLLRNFGLRTVINAVSPDDLRSIDMKSFESLAMHRRVQASSQSAIHRFGIDWTRDLLRAVTGTPTDPTFAKRVSGADALVICGHQTLDDAPGLCRRALDFYASDSYKQTNWSHIDFLQPEYDSGIIEDLDNLLADAIMHPNESNPPLLALDEIIDQTGIVSYSIMPSRRHETPNLDLKTLQIFIQQHDSKPPLEWVRSGYIKLRFADAPTSSTRHKIYDSLDWSTHYKNRLYVLTSGFWMRVDQDYARRLDECISKLAEPAVALPRAPADVMLSDKEKSHDKKGEGLYIEHVTADRYSFLKLHPATFKSDLMSEAVEPCDILGSNGALYYIKRGGEGAGLSHLFTQGLAAAVTLHNDAGYRRLFREKINTAARAGLTNAEEAELLSQTYCGHFPEAGINPSAIEVCFVVLRKTSKDWRHMSYLAKISLYEACRRLEVAKFHVRLQCVTPVRSPVAIRKSSLSGPHTRAS